MYHTIQKKIHETLADLPLKKSESLVSLFCDSDKLGYDYKREEIPFWNWAIGQKEKIDSIEVLAMHKDFRVIWTKLKSDYLKRSDERAVINKINSEYPYNLTVFSNKNETLWDFVNVKLVREEVDDENKDPKKRKIVRRITVSEENGLHTASERINELAVSEEIISSLKLQSIHDNAFDVEKVTKEFFIKIARKFMCLVGGTRKFGSRTEQFVKTLSLPGNQTETKYKEFAVRLIGRLLFCWFLKKKKSKSGVPLLSKQLFSSSAVIKHSNYYHQIIEPLFFEVLNTEFSERGGEYKNGIWEITPFLNGGLFEPHDDDHYEYYMGSSKYINTLKVPDKWLKELFLIFESYNFTIDENTSIDIDLSIDPEMLGKIFENLLAEINPETGKSAQKATGSYYTPRPIVEFMVDESLKQYLMQQTSLEEDILSSLMSYTDTEEVEIPELKQNKIIDALDSIKILDPACGSGAFPMGILQKMLLILQKVDKDSQKWISLKLQKIEDPLIRKALEKKIKNENWDYVRKLGIIQNSIFGVDIQQIAVEISKLRFFLSLIVDEDTEDDKENRGIIPLPNLEFKFVAANTLIGLTNETRRTMNVGGTEQIIDRLKQLRDEHFTSFGQNKKDIENEFIATQKKLAKHILEWSVYRSQAIQLSNWNPFSHELSDWFESEWMFGIKDGFDISIANPPYIQLSKVEGISNDYKLYLRDKFQTSGGRLNTFIFFLHQGALLLKKNGVMAFIIPNTILTQDYYAYTRKFILENMIIKDIVIFNEMSFESAVVENTTIVVCKNIQTDYAINIYRQNKDKVELLTLKKKSNFTSQDNYVLNIFSNKIIDKIFRKNLDSLFDHCIINQAIALKGDKSLTIKYENRLNKYDKLLEGRNIFKYGIDWDGKYLEYNLQRIHSCKRKDIFESEEKLLFRRVSESLIFTYDNEQYFALNTLVVVNLRDTSKLNLKFLLALLNSRLLNYIYKNKFKSTKKVFSEIQAKSVAKLPIVNIPLEKQSNIIKIVDEIIYKNRCEIDTKKLEEYIDKIVYELYGLSEEEIKIIEDS